MRDRKARFLTALSHDKVSLSFVIDAEERVPPLAREHDAKYDMEHDARSCKSLKSKQQFAISLAVVLCGLPSY